jgi:site-specific recombinase XerD
METRINIFFHIRKDKKTKEGLYPIYLRVTINAGRFEYSIQRSVALKKWSQEFGKAIGKDEEAKSINEFLEVLKHKVHVYQKELTLEKHDISIQNFRNKWFGISENKKMLLEVFREHNKKMHKLIGKDFAEGTYERYQTSLEHTERFIKHKYNATDLNIQKLNYEFISEYEFWLKSVRNCAHNTTMKYLTNFKKIVLICVKNGWLERDPFKSYKMVRQTVNRDILTEAELTTMMDKKFSVKRIEQVRDIFLFCCYTGLAYIDVFELKRSEIGIGVDGKKWIFTSRKKTDVLSRIPLLPRCIAIIDKYADNEQCVENDLLLPVLTNQKMNAYLKEIADVCGIQKELTFHIARHTFATTVTLNNGVPIETVSKMLGHSNLKTTQHYAKLLDSKVSEDMSKLSEKLQIKVASTEVKVI